MPKTISPKTTRPSALSRRKPTTDTAAKKTKKKLDAFPDKIDIRDWVYRPNLNALPDQIINCDLVPLILDQGEEGACTGFALAAVINFHMVINGRTPLNKIKDECVSPRMLYEMARRYDEWPGENYEGSSARGTMKGWNAHGVVRRKLWADSLFGPSNLDEQRSKEGMKIPAGAYYRVMHRQIRDMHSALNESGVLYATLMVHSGWDDPGGKKLNYSYLRSGKKKTITLPIIERKGRADGGHAIAIVGYTGDGFIIQNSWGKTWGYQGFAILPYEDWILHASDCWVVQVGVPIDTSLWSKGSADTDAGKQRASQLIPLDEIRPYVINIGNNGFLSDSGNYWTTEKDVIRLFETVGTTADQWQKKRIMLYLHGGLNSEKEVARRVIGFKQVCLDNEIYPVHIMWETDFWSSMKSNLFDMFTTDDRATASWLENLREATLEIKDRTFELSSAKLGTMLWDEMKENARLASVPGRSMDIVARNALAAFNQVSTANKDKWEIHIVAHSAGSIFTAYAIETLMRIGVPVKSIQFMAPAMSIELFKEKMLPHIRTNKCPIPTLYVLSNTGELDDDVGPYGKSLLYLVSNAFERVRGKPILGMEKFIRTVDPKLKQEVDKEMEKLFKNGNLVIAGAAPAGAPIGPDVCRSDSHGGFDNDTSTLNSVLCRILGKKPRRPFENRDLQF